MHLQEVEKKQVVVEAIDQNIVLIGERVKMKL
jgi:hypothetical protein